MAMEPEEIVERIAQLHPNAVIEIAGEDCNFEVYVVSDDFTGMLTMLRQQPILALFTEELCSGKLHALTVKARTHGELNAQTGLVQIQ